MVTSSQAQCKQSTRDGDAAKGRFCQSWTNLTCQVASVLWFAKLPGSLACRDSLVSEMWMSTKPLSARSSPQLLWSRGSGWMCFLVLSWGSDRSLLSLCAPSLAFLTVLSLHCVSLASLSVAVLEDSGGWGGGFSFWLSFPFAFRSVVLLCCSWWLAVPLGSPCALQCSALQSAAPSEVVGPARTGREQTFTTPPGIQLRKYWCSCFSVSGDIPDLVWILSALHFGSVAPRH